MENIIQQVDSIFLFIIAISAGLLLLITLLMIIFIFKYHKNKHPQAIDTHEHPFLEITWTVIPTILVLCMFYYGMIGYNNMRNPPKDSFVIKVTGRQWEWGFEYPNTKKTKELYVPQNKPIKLLMTSLDVIHSFFIPAFRVKMDLMPGRETFLWFKAEKLGDYDVFCAEYCGLLHSKMLSKVHVMDEQKFNNWYVTNEEVKNETNH